MSGHSKWATTHRQKEVTDAKRGAIFTKLANIITIAAKKGGDPDANAALRSAIDQARAANMPKDNIERAIKRGTGELAGDSIEELYYEGIIPPDVQVVVKCLSDNKNRSGAALRHLFTKNGGAFSSVLWNFEQLGVISISHDEIKAKHLNYEELELELIDKEIRDFKKEDDAIVIYTEIVDLQKIKDFLEKDKNIEIERAELDYIAKEKIEIQPQDQIKLDKFMEELEDNEDVNDFYTNFN
jgi:YebC/PmpR family DNA-binding regulatory protein